MPRGYRYILVAFVGWLNLAAAPPQQGSGKPADAANQNVANALNNVAAALQRPDEPKGYQEPCEDGDDERSSDLCAQWKAADAARSSANASWVSFYVGTLIGLLTLGAAAAAAWYAKEAANHTKSGSDEARRAADAAEQQLRHSDIITKAQLRTYFSAEAETLEVENGNVLLLAVKMRNVGQTPAREVRIRRPVYLVVNGKKVKGRYQVAGADRMMGTVPPNTPLEFYTKLEIKPGKLRALRAGVVWIEAEIIIDFIDAFDERWTYTQKLLGNWLSMSQGLLFTTSCHTEIAKTPETQEDELPLTGGGERA
jgi:hypothetical protein